MNNNFPDTIGSSLPKASNNMTKANGKCERISSWKYYATGFECSAEG